MHRWILPSFAILLLSIAVPIARSSGPWTAAATQTENTLVFDTHHELWPTSIYSDAENAEMAGQIDELQYLIDTRKYDELLALVRFPESPNVGTEAPNFELVRTDGKKIELSDLRGKIAIFMFAAMTSPPARLQIPRLESLQQAYSKKDVKIFLVYSRERHAGETGFPNYANADSFDRKLAYARELDAVTRLPIAVDDIDESVQGLYGGVPNSAWVVDREGTIVFRSTWADSKKLSQVVDRLMRFEHSAKS